MAGPEGQLKTAVLKRLKQLRRDDPTLAYRKRLGTVMGTAGDPDISGLWGGIHFEIELKAPGESPTVLQTARLAEWGRAGAVTGVAHSLNEFDRILKKVRAKITPTKSAVLPVTI